MRRLAVIGGCIAVAMSGCVSTLDRAVDSGDVEAAKRAIEKGGNVEGNFWVSVKYPLARAIANDDLQMIQILHQNGATIDSRYLSNAARASAMSTYKYLIENGADIVECSIDTDYPGYWGSPIENIMPPLSSAIARGQIQSVQSLLNLGAPLEQRCDVPLGGDYNFSAILTAAYFGSPEIIELLISKGSNPNRLSVGGLTPLSMAAHYGHYEAARVLLANGAFHSYSTQIRQPIEYASDSGHENIVNLLTYAGATRLRRMDPSKVLESITDTLVDGVILIGTIALIVEGAKYSGYQDGYISNRDSISNGPRPSQRQIQSVYTSDDNQCNNDFQCGIQQVCLKKPGHINGICVRDASNSRLSGERDSVSSGFTRDLEPYKTDDCDEGGRWDLIYQACVE